jgi:hypothetical protein
LLKGVDTAAEIKLNNRTLGRTENMFVCYRFGIEQILKVTTNLFTRAKKIHHAIEAKK